MRKESRVKGCVHWARDLADSVADKLLIAIT